MNQATLPVSIETDLFLFEAPDGYQVVSLDEEAELVGPNDEFLVVSSYSIEEDSDDELIAAFAQNISSAMIEAADEPDLRVTGKLKKETSEEGLPIWSLLAEATDQSHFFDQYAVVDRAVAVVVTIEGNYQNRTSTVAIEEAVHGIEFKQAID